MSKFSFYQLPFLGALAFLIASFGEILTPLLRVSASDFDIHYLFDLLPLFLPNTIMLSLIVFLLLIPTLCHFKLNSATLKNSLAVMAIVLVSKIIMIFINRAIIEAIYPHISNFYFFQQVLQIILRFTMLLLFWGLILASLYLFKKELDLSIGQVPQGQKKWLIVNLLSILGVFSFSLWFLLPFIMIIKSDYSLIAEFGVTIWFYLPVLLAILLLMFSKKIVLTTIKFKPILFLGILLASITLIVAIVGEWLIMLANHSSIGAFLIMLFTVPIICLIALTIFSHIIIRNVLMRRGAMPERFNY